MYGNFGKLATRRDFMKQGLTAVVAAVTAPPVSTLVKIAPTATVTVAIPDIVISEKLKTYLAGIIGSEFNKFVSSAKEDISRTSLGECMFYHALRAVEKAKSPSKEFINIGYKDGGINYTRCLIFYIKDYLSDFPDAQRESIYETVRSVYLRELRQWAANIHCDLINNRLPVEFASKLDYDDAVEKIDANGNKQTEIIRYRDEMEKVNKLLENVDDITQFKDPTRFGDVARKSYQYELNEFKWDRLSENAYDSIFTTYKRKVTRPEMHDAYDMLCKFSDELINIPEAEYFRRVKRGMELSLRKWEAKKPNSERLEKLRKDIKIVDKHIDTSVSKMLANEWANLHRGMHPDGNEIY